LVQTILPVGDLWSVRASDERTLTEYRCADEGSSVLLFVDLKDHLYLDEVVSHTVALQNFRVDCTKDPECGAAGTRDRSTGYGSEAAGAVLGIDVSW